MHTFLHIVRIIQYIFFYYFLISGLYYFTFAFAGLFRRRKTVINPLIDKGSFLILIPGYKEDLVIHEVAKDALNQNYPSDKFDVVVIADSFQKFTLKKLNKLDIRVIEVSFEISTKSKALNKAMSVIEKDYDFVIILDADNLMGPEFLLKMNATFSKGFKAIQGHRVAKNLDTSFSYLDAISEEVNNHIFRRGHRALGVSSALIGSGMAFDYQMYKDYMATIESHAEDKELELKLFKDRRKIEFVDDAKIYDEKVSQSDVFLTQRSRWIANQVLYGKKYFFQAIRELFKGNIDFFDKVFQYMLLPRIVLLGLVYIVLILSLLFNPLSFSIKWGIVFLLVNMAIAFSVPKYFYSFSTLKHLLKLPQGFVLMLFSIFRFQEARKGFNPTPHTGMSNKTKKEKS